MDKNTGSGYEDSASHILDRTIHLLRDEAKKYTREYIERFREEDRPLAKEELIAFINHELIDYIRGL